MAIASIDGNCCYIILIKGENIDFRMDFNVEEEKFLVVRNTFLFQFIYFRACIHRRKYLVEQWQPCQKTINYYHRLDSLT